MRMRLRPDHHTHNQKPARRNLPRQRIQLWARMRHAQNHRTPRPHTRKPENDPGNDQDIDWGTFINDYHELIDRYREAS